MGIVYSFFSTAEENRRDDDEDSGEEDYSEDGEEDSENDGTDTGSEGDKEDTDLELDEENVNYDDNAEEYCKKCYQYGDGFKSFPVVPDNIKELVHRVVIPSIFVFPENLPSDEVTRFEHNIHYKLLDYYDELIKGKDVDKAIQLQDLFKL